MANVTPKNHDFRKILASYGGVPIRGYADEGSALSWTANGDSVTASTGPDGDTVISQLPNVPARVTLRLMATSLSNSYLSSCKMLQDAGGSSQYKPMSITDANTGTTLTAAVAWIVRQPDLSFGSEAGVVEWIIEGKWVQKVGGAA